MLLGLIVNHRFLAHAGVGQETGDTVCWQRAYAHPVFNAFIFKHQSFGMVLGDHRVVGANLFDKAAIARAAGIGNNEVIEGTFFCAAPG